MARSLNRFVGGGFGRADTLDAGPPWAHHGLVAEAAPLGRDHVWFVDARTGDRRLRVSSHPDRRLVVLSLWQGGACTGTFRLPVEDAPRLIAVLAADLGAAVATPTGEPGAGAPGPGESTTAGGRWRRWRRWRRHATGGRGRSGFRPVGSTTVIDLDQRR